MKIFKSIFYFLLLLIVCESIALGAVAWSFLESSLTSFELLKIGSDNRARDTLGTLAKAAENSGVDGSYEDMNFVFSRMTKVSDRDTDGYTIREIFLTSEDGIVLAHSNPEYLGETVKKRKPVALYQDVLYTRAFRLRKWQIGIPVLLGQKKEVLSKSVFFSKFESFFPEIDEPEILLSAAVYHPVKLERVAAIHMIYDRGNFRKFVFRQTELLEWLLRNYSLIALGAALFLEFIYLLLTLGNSRKESVPDLSSRPFVEKVSHSKETHVPVLAKQSSPLDSVVFPGSPESSSQNTEDVSIQTPPVLTASTIPQTQVEPAPIVPVATGSTEKVEAAAIPIQPVISQVNPTIAPSQEEVLDAIYLG
ncbi:LIC_12071 family protein [Leptospira alstonii]|uniref:Uncharacterized protein n=2 Tax=Leptospira alstonii TaxID=28452 RepID=M6CRM9_9LEPT|nr:hypothetical protein [Leptospira alstonii]EMJ93191.1 hypothetical protein LEP1GSC194_1855 [Leptospira alstonii serovar Sichuan str. 79601]EQA78425.1 hypothetical protein LEP1GSC193_4198 [Leptospira alstonii serovar Pingchang str. 80-412]